MLGAEDYDNLEWLAGRHAVTVARNPASGQWSVDLGWCEMPDASFSGPRLDALIAAARQWDETPAGERLDGDDWLRLCAAAGRQGKPVRDLIRQGARELLGRLDSGA